MRFQQAQRNGRLPRVLIAGAGVAGLETLLALHALAGDRVEITLLAPEAKFINRPMSVDEPFKPKRVRGLKLAEVAAEFGASWHSGTLDRVDHERRVALTAAGDEISYDKLVLALGACPEWEWDAQSYCDGHNGEAYRLLLHQLREGRISKVAFVKPAGASWPLPLYDLALKTAADCAAHGRSGVELTVVTPEEEPLGIFGHTVSDAIRRLLEKSDARSSTNVVSGSMSPAMPRPPSTSWQKPWVVAIVAASKSAIARASRSRRVRTSSSVPPREQLDYLVAPGRHHAAERPIEPALGAHESLAHAVAQLAGRHPGERDQQQLVERRALRDVAGGERGDGERLAGARARLEHRDPGGERAADVERPVAARLAGARSPRGRGAHPRAGGRSGRSGWSRGRRRIRPASPARREARRTRSRLRGLAGARADGPPSRSSMRTPKRRGPPPRRSCRWPRRRRRRTRRRPSAAARASRGRRGR